MHWLGIVIIAVWYISRVIDIGSKAHKAFLRDMDNMSEEACVFWAVIAGFLWPFFLLRVGDVYLTEETS